MPSEYDFLLPYSRRLRRVGAWVMGAGAFLAGAACMAAIVALPMRPFGGSDTSTAQATSEATVPPAGKADQPVQAEQKPASAIRTAAAGKPDEKPAATKPGPDAGTPPAQAASSGAMDRRETTGISSATAKPAETVVPQPSPAPSSINAADAAKPVDTVGSTPASAQSSSSSGKSKSAERRKSRSKEAQASRQQQRRYARAADERAVRREFVDDQGTRHVVMPGRWRERDYDASAFAYDQRQSRRILIIRRPSFFGDDD